MSSDLFKKAVSFHQNKKLKQAEKFYREVLAIDSDHVSSIYNLGLVLQESGKRNEARELYNKAIDIKPDYANAYNSLGLLLVKNGEYEQAISALKKAIEIKPDSVFFTNLASAYISSKNIRGAKIALTSAIKRNSRNFTAQVELARIFQEEKNLVQAKKHYSQALEVKPDSDIVLYYLAKLYAQEGSIKLALETFERGLKINPDNIKIIAEKFLLKQKICDWTNEKEDRKKILKRSFELAKSGKNPGIKPFDHLTICNDAEQNFYIAKYYSDKISEIFSAKKEYDFTHLKNKTGKLRIGCISADYREHPFGNAMKYFFAEHDKNKYELFAYSLSGDDGSEVHNFFKNTADQFIYFNNVSDEDAAERIYNDEINILIDFTGYTEGGRLEITAQKPAPIIVNMCGYPGTTGANWFDYIVADKELFPEEQHKFYSEQIVGLNIAMAQHKLSGKEFCKSDFGLPEDAFVISVHCPAYKLDPITFDVWMEILNQVPEAILWLRDMDQLAKDNILKEAEARGVDSKRIYFAKKIKDRSEFLKRLTLIDVVMDTRIYNGGTTTVDALWAGVPVITVPGKNYMSRYTASCLNNIGMPELIAENFKQYKTMAINFAKNSEELEKIKAKIWAKIWESRTKSTLFDTKNFIHRLGEAYEIMWKIYVNGEKPHKIELF